MPTSTQNPGDTREPFADDLRGKAVHFVGIGGCGMSGLARMTQAAGATVSGTDTVQSAITDALIAQGIAVGFDQQSPQLPDPCDLLVYSAAIPAEHPERQAAEHKGIETIKYAQMLGRMMHGRRGVAIAGTHGKSTTTAMLAHILIQCELDPNFIIGATCEQIGGGARVGQSDMLLAEACEYDRSFHHLRPSVAAVLNVEEDHLDIYGSLDAIIEAFHGFAQLLPDAQAGGYLLIHHDRAQRTRVAAGLASTVQTIGFSPEADWQIRINDHVTLTDGDEVNVEFQPPLPGEHMAYNASVACVLANRLGAAWQRIVPAIEAFAGLDRRMQYLGKPGGVDVVIDYGHHPTEIDATLRALEAHHQPRRRGGRVICVFQPHQHSRTRFLLKQFASSFSQADVVIVPPIYFVRDSEADRRAVSATDLVYALQQRGVLALTMPNFDDIVTFLNAHCHREDLLIVMGAGPVWEIGHRFTPACEMA